MADNTINPYLRDAVMTATPEQLQLMLYDGAIRFATRGREAIEARNFEGVYENLTRAQRIVLEMQQGLRPEVAPELCDRMSAMYSFIYRRLVDGCVRREAQAVDEALHFLQYERETWVMLLDKLAKVRAEAQSPTPTPAANPLVSATVPGMPVETFSVQG